MRRTDDELIQRSGLQMCKSEFPICITNYLLKLFSLLSLRVGHDISFGRILPVYDQLKAVVVRLNKSLIAIAEAWP